MKTRERYKHWLNFLANLITLCVEGGLFAWMWYTCYSQDIVLPFYNRGNWAVIAIYMLFVFFFTHVFGGYKIGYMRIMDIALSHVLAVFCSGVVAYLEICMVARNYVDFVPLIMQGVASILFVIPWIIAVRKLYTLIYPPRQMLVIYGEEYFPDELIKKINTRKDKYNICASICSSVGKEKLFEVIDRYEAIVLCDLSAVIRNDIMKYCYEKSIRTYITPKISDILFRAGDDLHLFDTPLFLFRNQGLTIDQRFLKRAFDIIVSLIGIVIASPFMLIIAIAIKLYDGGPILYKQMRLTRDGKEFEILKFRSMSVDSEVKGARLAAKGDSRVTPVGKIIRNIHFDELPQLFNILKGDMSVVGPRPERRVIADQYLEEIPEFDMRLKVKAGLTGYAQVYGKYNTTPYDKLKMDITYIENYSFWLDIRIMFLTFKILFQKENTEGVDAEQTTASKKNDAK